MKVLFIYHNIDTKNIPHFPLGIGVLSGFLKKQGIDNELIFIQDNYSEDDLINHIRKISPDLIAFSTVTLQWKYTKRYAKVIKSNFDIPIICGGIHPTFMSGQVIEDPNIDMICIGEGGEALVELVEHLEAGKELNQIENIWLKTKDGKIFKNDIRRLSDEMDSLPFPNREIMPFQELINQNKTEPVFMTSRGCPYNCRFCSNSGIKRMYRHKGRYVRQRSPENVIEEIGRIKDKYEFDSLNFYDESFGYNHKWVDRFCRIYESEFNLPFGAFIRAETMDRETFRKLRKAGLTLIYLGVESGNEKIRRKVMNRKVSNDVIIKTCLDAKAEGIQVWTFNMIGVPGETKETIEETMELNRIINPHHACVSIYQPFPGTSLYDECVKKGYIKKEYSTSFYHDSILDLPTITRQELLEMYEKFQEMSEKMRLDHEKRGDKIFLVDI